MRAPFVGPPASAVDLCAYSADLDAAGCTAAPVSHLIVDALGWGVVGLSSCADHAGIARLSGRVVDEHPHGERCADGDCVSA